MSDKQQTAVEWLFNELERIEKVYYRNTIIYTDARKEAYEKAKQMGNEQIAKAFDDGDYNYYYSRKTGNDFEDGQEYFNEVYGTENL